MLPAMNDFFTGMAAAGSCAIGLYMIRLWRDVRDRFFLLFGLAFWMLAVHWSALALSRPPLEHRHYVYLSRLAAFVLIIAAIADKNRSRD
jgi:hypothetical protein